MIIMRKNQLNHHINNNSLSLKIIPSALLLLATFLTMVDIPLPFTNHVNPFLPAPMIFFLSLWQPRFLSIWVVFIAGLLYDAMQSTPVGVYALLFLIMRQITCRMRNKTGFIFKPLAAWWRFLIIGVIFFVIEWALISVLLDYNIYSNILLWRNLFTILLYPIIHSLVSSLIAYVQNV
jgi:rod shape-determining protein MreD